MTQVQSSGSMKQLLSTCDATEEAVRPCWQSSRLTAHKLDDQSNQEVLSNREIPHQESPPIIARNSSWFTGKGVNKSSQSMRAPNTKEKSFKNDSFSSLKYKKPFVFACMCIYEFLVIFLSHLFKFFYFDYSFSVQPTLTLSGLELWNSSFCQCKHVT